MSTPFHLPVVFTVRAAAELAPQLLAALESPGDLVLDATAVDSVDTAGLQLLQSAHKSCMGAGKRLCLLHPSEVLTEALALYDLQDLGNAVLKETAA